MIKIKNQINFLIILLFFVLTNFLTSCGGGSKTVLPDAPPPYPDSPFVKEVQPGSFNQSTFSNTTGRDYYNRNRNVGSSGWNRSDTGEILTISIPLKIHILFRQKQLYGFSFRISLEMNWNG